jgi:hypothetical protein
MRIVLACFAGLSLAACGPGQNAPDDVVSVLDNAGEPAASPAPAFEGRWETVLETSVDPRPLVLTIDLSGESEAVVMTAPSQGGAQIAFEQIRLDGDRIGFATPLGALRFEGALNGEDHISGEVFQGGYRSPLVWRRSPDQP